MGHTIVQSLTMICQFFISQKKGLGMEKRNNGSKERLTFNSTSFLIKWLLHMSSLVYYYSQFLKSPPLHPLQLPKISPVSLDSLAPSGLICFSVLCPRHQRISPQQERSSWERRNALWELKRSKSRKISAFSETICSFLVCVLMKQAMMT